MNPTTVTEIHWLGRAKCRGVDTNLFFPDPDGENNRSRRREAEKFCIGCRAIIDCAIYAMENRETNGVWGGSSAWSYRNRKENLAYIEKLKLDVEYERLRALPTSNQVRKKISNIVKARNSITA